MRRSRLIVLATTGIFAAAVGAAVVGPAPAALGAAGHPIRPASQSRPAAATRVLTFLDSSSMTLKATSGRKLHLLVSAFRSGNSSRSSASITLSTSRTESVGENHQWSFPLKHSAFTYSTSTGRGKLATGKQLQSFGMITLAFKKNSQKTSSCSGGTLTRIKGTLSGKLFFNSNTHWGKVGSKKHSMKFKVPNFMTLEHGCSNGGQGGSPPCVQATGWSGPGSSFDSSFFGFSMTGSNASSTISVSSNVQLSKPAGASRYDTLIAKEPAPSQHGNSLNITTSGSTITGSASIATSGASPSSFACSSSGQQKTQKIQNYSGNWSSPSGLTAHFQAIGNVSSATSGSASFYTESFH